MLKAKFKALKAYPTYRKKIIEKQKRYDEMVLACANDNNAVICGERPHLIGFIDAIVMIAKGR